MRPCVRHKKVWPGIITTQLVRYAARWCHGLRHFLTHGMYT